jgi:hypothetical protein
MDPVSFHGEAFSEYYCTKLLWTDPQLGKEINQKSAENLYKQASSTVRFAQRQLRDREQARSTYSLLLERLCPLLGWRIGKTSKIVTELEQEEEGGVPLLDGDDDRVFSRVLCIAPDAHLDAAPAGLHRRFAPTQSLARVLREQELDYGVVINAFELRLVCTVGTLPSYIGFDLTAIAEGGDAGLQTWKLLHALLNRAAIASHPPLLDRVRKIGGEHQLSVSNTLGRQVQSAVVRFMQGVLDHPENRDRIAQPVTDTVLHDLYQETLRYLYRLLFVLYAEDLNLLPMDVLTYREGYSLHRLVRLAREAGDDAVEVSDPNGSFFQASLDAMFALIRVGCDLGPEGRIKPYGGGLFNSGSTEHLNQLVLGNAMLDNVIELLTVIPAPKGQVGKIRLSYRELNVEQLGSIYEGLLEQSPAFARNRLWRCELDSRIVVINDADRERIREIRGEKLTTEGLSIEDDDDEDLDGAESDESEVDETTDDAELSETENEESDVSGEDEEQPKKKKSAKKPLKVLAEIPQGTVYLRGSQARKQSGSYYTSRAFVEFLVREALDPMADGKSAKEILSLKVVDPAMGSAHFLVGATRRLAGHLLAAYRREVARLRADNLSEDVPEDDLLVLADVPDELIQVWGSADEERELAVCRLIVAGNCIYGVDKNPLAVDLAKVSLWLVTAASQFPLSFIDHRLQCGDSLLGIPAAEVVRPWVRPAAKTRAKPKAIKPFELMISPKSQTDIFDFGAPSHKALCVSFGRAFQCLRDLNRCVHQEPTNFALHQAQYGALRGTLRPWWELHQLRVGFSFSRTEVTPDILNNWLRDFVETGKVTEQHRIAAEPHRQRGEQAAAFCWELAFPEVFFDETGQRRPDAGFSCVLGNPPWDKIKPERDGFYLAYEPLIRQYQGTAKNRRIAELHQQNPAIAAAWDEYEFQTKALSGALSDGGIYAHQTAIVEEETEGDDGEMVVKKKTTGGDPDCYKFFLERAWQLTASDRAVGMVMSSSLHNGQGATGLRRLMLDQCRLRVLVKFDNELRVFPGVHNQFKFDIVVVDKGGQTTDTDAAFFSRETEQALQQFRSHRAYLKVPADEIRKLSPQTLTLFEFRGQRDVDLVQKAYRLHPTFGDGLMQRLGLKFRREFDMGNSNYLFRTRNWLRQHGCTQEPGEQWRAADAEWYSSRGYVERPLAQWYVLYEGDKVVAHKIPWEVKSKKGIRERDLDDFTIQFKLPGGLRFFGKVPDDSGHESIFVPPDEVRETDFPAYIPAAKKLKDFTFGPAIRPSDAFVPLMEGKWIYQFNDRAYAYVSGSGSWVVTRPVDVAEHDLIPHYFMAKADADTRTPGVGTWKVGFRDVSSASNERTVVAALIAGDIPCNHKTPTFALATPSRESAYAVSAWLSSITSDFFARVSGGNTSLSAMKQRPTPSESLTDLHDCVTGRKKCDRDRALLDAMMAGLFELTPSEYAYILSLFPLLDRDQPPLPHDYRIRATNKGVEWKRISFITRDLALLTYVDYLAGRLDVKPDAERVRRICPDGVPEPPNDIVAFFAAAGVDIGGTTDYAVAATGPYRNLRARVAKARELGAVAYVPTIDRRRATFVEQAAAAGGLSPDEGVLTPEMSASVLRDKAARAAKWAKAMELWEQTPNPRASVASAEGGPK